MKNMTQFYLEFIKILAVIVGLFALFGFINDSILGLLLPNGATIDDLASDKGVYRILYLSQIIGCFLIIFTLYKNYFQFLSFYKSKIIKKKLSKRTTTILIVVGIILIINLYIALL